MTWLCFSCGEINKVDFPPNIDWTNPRVIEYLKKIQSIEDRGEDPFSMCTHCRKTRSDNELHQRITQV